MTTIPQALELALQHHRAGNLQQAEMIYRQILQTDPSQAEAWNLLGVLGWQTGRHDLALDFVGKAIALVPHNAMYHFNLGVAYQSMGRFAEAVAALETAGRLKSDWPELQFNLGNVFKAQKKWDEAIACFRRAVQLQPSYAEAWNNLGTVYASVLNPAEAVACYQTAVQHKPDFQQAFHNMGAALFQLGRLDEAEASYNRTVELQPDGYSAHFGRALTWLFKGDYERGWIEYEWRWKLPGNPLPQFAQPAWDGSPLKGRTLLLYPEQGLGDVLQIIRYAPLLQQQGGKVVFQCPRALVQLLARTPGIDQLVPKDAPLPPFDVHAPLLSLPRFFKTTLATIPAQIPYLFADPALVEHWSKELAALPGFKIGIAWQGDPKLVEDKQRSIPLRYFEPLARLDGVHLISLQKGLGSEQVADVRFPVTVLPLDEKTGPFMDTAAVMKNLDLVIAADTAIAHLAGALGVPVWLALSLFPYDWRWHLGRDDSPWYPNLRIFRQVELDNWTEIFERLTAAVSERLGRPMPTPPIAVPIAPAELIDKITILEIKAERISDAAKLANVRAELAALVAVRDRSVRASPALAERTAELKKTNETIWEIEDAIRDCERRQEFGPDFIELARSVYRTNDRRAAIKRQINELLGSRFLEEKSYTAYD
jgi:tetratricopeptide (TPR) repeat protein